MKKENNKLRNAGVLGTLLVGFVAATLVLSLSVPEVTEEKIRSWHYAPMITGDNDPGAGNSGVLIVYIHKHNDDGETFYGSNITVNSSVLASGDGNNTHIGSSVNHTTPIDIVIKVRWNQTHAFASGNNTWMWNWVNGWLNCTGLSISTLEMTEVNITASGTSTYAFAHYVANNSNNGYQLTKGQNVTSTVFNFNYYG